MTTDNAIMLRIELKQRGKQGIYPYRLAQDVASELDAPMQQVMDCVIAHIRAEIDKAAEIDADRHADFMRDGFGKALKLTERAIKP